MSENPRRAHTDRGAADGPMGDAPVADAADPQVAAGSTTADEGLDRAIGAGQLGSTARLAVLWTFAGQWGGYLIQTVTTIILARYLSPGEFGLVGMALTLTVFADQFRSLGLSQAVIQRDDLTWRQVNALFYVNSFAGIVLAGIVALCAPLLALFYGRPELVDIILVLSLTYVVAGIGVQPHALLARKMSFKAIAVRNTAAKAVGSVLAIVAAVLGAGYWSLVVLQVAVTVFSVVFVWFAIRWRPGAPRGIQECGPLVRFGAGFSLGELSNTMARNADNILIGWALGATQLGLYSRAYSLLMLPIRQLKTPLGTVVLPMLAAIKGEPERYRRLYCGTISGLAHAGMPLIAGLAVCAHDLIEVLLGEQWLAAATMFQLLAVAGIVQMVSSTSGWLLITQGRSADYAKMSAVVSVFTVASFVAGLPWGAEGVAAAGAIGSALIAVPVFWYTSRGTVVTVGAILGAMWRPLVVSAVIAGAMLGARYAVPSDSPWLGLGVGILSGGLTWALVLLAWRRARVEVTGLVAIMRRREAPTAAGPGSR